MKKLSSTSMWVSKMPLSVVACWTAHGKYAQKLLTDLFANYTSALRPVEDTNNILNVTLQVTLSQIIDMVKQCKVCAFTTQWYSMTYRKKINLCRVRPLMATNNITITGSRHNSKI